MVQVDGEAARDVALNFISRWNHHREWNENQPFINWRVPDLNETKPAGMLASKFFLPAFLSPCSFFHL
jgi:phosphatidylserine/phosphatidylglycerophosphate/cardiolipin synthase-like enzyme